MTGAVYPLDPVTLVASSEAAREAAKPYAADYQSQTPYNHGGFENFLPPEILERVREELKELPEAESSFDRAQEKLKFSYLPERLPPTPVPCSMP